MPTNVEIKARVNDFEALQKLAETLSDTPCQIIPQEDTFFYSPHGRLKLRVLALDRGQLVYYLRPDAAGPKRSEYHIFETSDPAGLKLILAAALGVSGVVSKIRYLYLTGQTRIHLDDVKGLGQFVELEVVMHPGQSEAEGQAIAEGLMRKLGIKPADLIELAYMDLLEK
jgi:predicted adenylyl cyclase CyaB